MHRKDTANRVLLFVFCLFAAAMTIKYYYPGQFMTDLFFMVSEAALIGGIADWFAVTALFRRPLGFPWHTELIPRNRERVTQSIINVVAQDLLSAEAIQKRIASIHIMDAFIDWVDNKNGKQVVGQFAAKTALHFLRGIDAAQLAVRLEWLIQQNVSQLIVLPELESAGKWALKQGRVEQLFQFMLEELQYVVAKPSTLEAIYHYLDNYKDKKTKHIAARLVLWLGEQTDSINTREAARALQFELLSLLAELKASDHPIHAWAVSRIADNISLLARDEAFHQAIGEWTTNALEQISLADIVGRALDTAEATLESWLKERYSSGVSFPPLMVWIFDQVAAYWNGFKEDPDIHQWVEHYVKRSLFRLAETEHHLIGRIVKEALDAFDNQALSDFIEEKAGGDLQWIRINGSVVGGIVGLLLFLFLRLIYDPYVVPIIRSQLL